MNELLIDLPFPPTVNKIWRTTKKGKVYLIKTVKNFRKEVHYLVFNKTKFGKNKLRVEIKIFPPDNRKRDIDNLVKSTLDALQKANIFEDDFQIHQLYIEKSTNFQNGKITVLIKDIENEFTSQL